MKALLEKLKLTKVESSPPPLVVPIVEPKKEIIEKSVLPPVPPKPIDIIEILRQEELNKPPPPKPQPVFGNLLPIAQRTMSYEQNIPLENVGINGPSLTDYQSPPNLTYAGGRPIYLTDVNVQADVSRWALYSAVQNVDMNNNTFINLPEITLPVINLVGPTGMPGVMNMTDNLGNSYPLDSRDGNLYFDGELLAKANDIQNISDWALYPAIANVDMATFNVIGATSVETNQLKNVGGDFGIAGQLLSITGADAEAKITWIDPPPVGVTELNPGGNTGIVGLNSSGGSVTITNPAPGVINFEVPVGVTELNPGNNTGIVGLTSSGGSVTITNPAEGVINFEVPAVDVGVISLNTKTGNVDLISTDASVTITPVPLTSNVDLSVPGLIALQEQVATIEGEVVTLQGEVATIQGEIIVIDGELTTLTTGLGALSTVVAGISASYVTQVNNTVGAVQVIGVGGIGVSTDTGTGIITIDGSGASAGVSAITTNGGSSITNIVNLVSGSGITLTPAGQDITIASSGGGVTSLSGLTGALSLVAGTGISITPSGTDITIANTVVNSIPYTLSGTSGGGVIVNRATGSTASLPINTFTLISQITFNLPATLNATDSVYYDGWNLSDFSANFNSFWGVSYITNTFATPTDLIGSTTVTANALNYSNIQQIYLPLNVIIPPTNITAGGTVTLFIYANATSNNHFLTIPPVNTARIGVVKD